MGGVKMMSYCVAMTIMVHRKRTGVCYCCKPSAKLSYNRVGLHSCLNSTHEKGVYCSSLRVVSQNMVDVGGLVCTLI